jgi:hypothetical protein
VYINETIPLPPPLCDAVGGALITLGANATTCRRQAIYILVSILCEAHAHTSAYSLCEGDSEFVSKEFITLNKGKGIRVDTSVAADNHFTAGNKLGIIDRFTRTLKEYLSTSPDYRIRSQGN